MYGVLIHAVAINYRLFNCVSNDVEYVIKVMDVEKVKAAIR
jgi:hypothetical protein